MDGIYQYFFKSCSMSDAPIFNFFLFKIFNSNASGFKSSLRMSVIFKNTLESFPLFLHLEMLWFGPNISLEGGGLWKR